LNTADKIGEKAEQRGEPENPALHTRAGATRGATAH